MPSVAVAVLRLGPLLVPPSVCRDGRWGVPCALWTLAQVCHQVNVRGRCWCGLRFWYFQFFRRASPTPTLIHSGWGFEMSTATASLGDHGELASSCASVSDHDCSRTDIRHKRSNPRLRLWGTRVPDRMEASQTEYPF